MKACAQLRGTGEHRRAVLLRALRASPEGQTTSSPPAHGTARAWHHLSVASCGQRAGRVQGRRDHIPSVGTPWSAEGGVSCRSSVLRGPRVCVPLPSVLTPGQCPVTGGWVSWRWQGRRALSCCHVWAPLQSSRSSALHVHQRAGLRAPRRQAPQAGLRLGSTHDHHARSPVLSAQLLVSRRAWQTWPARRSRPQARVGSAFWPLWVSSQRLRKGHRGGCGGPCAGFSAPTGHTPLGTCPWPARETLGHRT